MFVTAKCRQCGKVYRIRHEKSHKRFRCRQCGNIAETVGSKLSNADDEFLATLAAAEEEAATLPAIGSDRPSNNLWNRNEANPRKSNLRPAKKTVFWKTPALVVGLVAAAIIAGTTLYYRHRSADSMDHNPPAGEKTNLHDRSIYDGGWKIVDGR